MPQGPGSTTRLHDVQTNRYLQAMEHRYPTLLPLALLSLTSVAQAPFERADQRTQFVHHTACAAVDDGYLVGGMAGNESGVETNGFVCRYDSVGGRLWSLNVGGEDFGTMPNAILPAEENGFYLCGQVNGCDVGPWELSSLSRYDALGNQLWFHWFRFPFAQGATRGPSGTIAMWNADSVLVLTASGDSVTAWPTSFTQTAHVFWMSDTTLLIVGDSGIRTSSIIGTAIATTDLSMPPLCVVYWNNQVIALSASGQLSVLDDALSSVTTLDLGGPFEHGQLLIGPQGLWAAGNVSCALLDSSLSVVSELPVDPLDEFGPTSLFGFDLRDDRFAMCSNTSAYERRAGLLRTVTTDGLVPQPLTDVEASIDGIDSLWYTVNQGFITYPRVNVNVRIANHGPDTVSSLALNYYYGPWICSHAGVTEHYSGLSIAPDEHDVLTIHDIPIGSPPWQTDSLTIDFCIAALSPNSIWDRDMSDNLACDTVNIVLGIGDNWTSGAGIAIGNPFTDAIEMMFSSAEAEPLRATLFDATGRQLAATTIAAGSTRFHWDLPGLSEGVHILRLEGRSTSTMRKLVHQHP